MNKICLKTILCLMFLVFLISFSNCLFAQSNFVADSIKEKIRQYAEQNTSAAVFVHFDKNVYANNEHVWFTGYLLNDSNAAHKILAVGLMRNDDRTLFAEGKFKIQNGLAFGNLILPDSLPTGDYTFMCYTDHVVNGTPSTVFQQPVTIKSSGADGFVVELILRDSIQPGIDSATVLVRAYKQDLTPVSKAALDYFIGERVNPLQKGKLMTNKIGEVEIKIPLKQVDSSSNVLQMDLSNGAEVKSFSLKLPLYKKMTSVKFYPEGGHLVSGAKNVVGCEAKNNAGEPQEIKAGLFENDRRIATIYTDGNGMGKFTMIPQAGNQYYVRMDNAQGTDSIFHLPNILENGAVLSVANAIVSDTLRVELTKPKADEQWTVVIHNYRDSYLDFSIPVTTKHLTLKIALDEVPKGLHAITLFDAAGRPRSERIFFAHFDKSNIVKISTDTSTYTTRQKVKLHVKVLDKEQKPMKAVFSMGAVQANRIDPKKMMDIESYFYLKNELSAFPSRSMIMNNDAENREYLEMVLLIKAWRKYLWQDVEKTKLVNNPPQNDSLLFQGFVLKNNKPLKKPIQIIVSNVVDSKISGLDGIDTDSTGGFVLPMNMIEHLSSKGVIKLAVLNQDKLLYKLVLNDPYKEMSKKLGQLLQLADNRLFIASQSSRSAVLPSGEVAKQMATVVIKTKKDNSIYWTRGANACGDYVCQYNILNCLNHPPGTNGTHEPVVGERYGVNGIQTVYSGCSELWKGKNRDFETTIDGLRMPMEFYVDDLSKKVASDPQYLSTIYWGHALVTDSSGEASVEFFTGDIAGRFRVILQGITENDVIYGEQFFDVVK